MRDSLDLTCQRIDTDGGTHLLKLPSKGHVFLDFILVLLGEFLQIRSKGVELLGQLNVLPLMTLSIRTKTNIYLI